MKIKVSWTKVVSAFMPRNTWHIGIGTGNKAEPCDLTAHSPEQRGDKQMGLGTLGFLASHCKSWVDAGLSPLQLAAAPAHVTLDPRGGEHWDKAPLPGLFSQGRSKWVWGYLSTRRSRVYPRQPGVLPRSTILFDTSERAPSSCGDGGQLLELP